uniref:Glycoside hydrolase family 19 catalytic domain-containing protein n=1 Tax=Quercus lobata TaxID=97700 RepID=A0A7N2L6K7_QUELO
MEYRPLFTTALILLVLVNCPKFSSLQPQAQMRPCEKGPCSKTQCCHGSGKCRTITFRCCDGTVTDYLQSDQFENMFSNRNSLEAHAKGFWDYHSFITASAEYEPYGFGTTYLNWNFFGTKEVAAFLAHAGTKTSCEYYFIREILS